MSPAARPGRPRSRGTSGLAPRVVRGAEAVSALADSLGGADLAEGSEVFALVLLAFFPERLDDEVVISLPFWMACSHTT